MSIFADGPASFTSKIRDANLLSSYMYSSEATGTSPNTELSLLSIQDRYEVPTQYYR